MDIGPLWGNLENSRARNVEAGIETG